MKKKRFSRHTRLRKVENIPFAITQAGDRSFRRSRVNPLPTDRQRRDDGKNIIVVLSGTAKYPNIERATAIEDGRIVTGQNLASGDAVADLVITQLKKRNGNSL